MSSTTLPKLKLKINVQIEAEKGHKSNITDRLSCRPLPGGSGGKVTAAAFLLPPHRRLSGCRQSCVVARTAVAGPRLAHPALGSRGSCPGRQRRQIRAVPTQIWWGGEGGGGWRRSPSRSAPPRPNLGGWRLWRRWLATQWSAACRCEADGCRR